MSNNIVEATPAAAPQPSGGAIDKIRKQARQLAYDVRYKVKSKFKEGQKADPASLKGAFMKQLNSSPAPGPVKQMAKKMLVGEEYDFVDVSKDISKLVGKIFSEHHQKDKDGNTIPHEDELSEEDMKGGKYKVRVTDKKSGKSYVRMADRTKIAELRKNPNISSVEMTGYGTPYEGEKKRGEQTSKVKSGKGLDPVGKEDGDVDNDGDKDSSDKYLMKRRKAIGKAMAKEEFIGEVADSKPEEKEKKMDVMKGKNKVVVNPKLGEAMEMDKKEEKPKKKEEVDPRSIPTMVNLVKNKMRARGIKMDQPMPMMPPTSGQKLNMYNQKEVDGDLVDEAKIDDKLRKDAEPIKGGGLYKSGMNKKVMGDRKVKVRRDMSAYGTTSISGKEQAQRQKEHQARRGVKENINPFVQSSLEALGSIVKKKSNLDEEGYDVARDQGKVKPSKDKKDATTMPVSDEVKKTQKVNKGSTPLDFVKKKYGKAVMNVDKKKKDEKEEK